MDLDLWLGFGFMKLIHLHRIRKEGVFMQIKFNPELIIEPFEDGRIITEVATLESYYLEENVFEVLAPCQEEYKDTSDFSLPENVTDEEFKQFIDELIELRVLLAK